MQASSSEAKQITVTITVTEPSGGTAALLLYLRDERLACAPATLAASTTIDIPVGETSATVKMDPDLTAKQAGKSYHEMVEPSFYLSLEVASSTLTYANSPAFGIALGGTATLQLKPK